MSFFLFLPCKFLKSIKIIDRIERNLHLKWKKKSILRLRIEKYFFELLYILLEIQLSKNFPREDFYFWNYTFTNAFCACIYLCIHFFMYCYTWNIHCILFCKTYIVYCLCLSEKYFNLFCKKNKIFFFWKSCSLSRWKNFYFLFSWKLHFIFNDV